MPPKYQSIRKHCCLNIKSHLIDKFNPHVHNTSPLESLNLALAATSACQPFVSLGKGSVGSYLCTGSFPLGGAGICLKLRLFDTSYDKALFFTCLSFCQSQFRLKFVGNILNFLCEIANQTRSTDSDKKVGETATTGS